ncbi:MAG: protein phosphatase 2C domain-containing protein [Bifidobacteriaceae bacterium]|nr:protein phosphatase 2C domain-containing protein [Bifidobacteriaceae bacterium]
MIGLAAAAATDVGKVRAANEDALFAADPVFVVADGMGGHNAGEVAAAIAVEELGRLARQAEPITAPQVVEAVAAARDRIAQLPRGPSGRAAGTTLTGAILSSQDRRPVWLVVNLGDSRTYRLAGGVLERLTEDHSEVEEMVQAGHITPAQARLHPRRHVVTRALGAGVVCAPQLRAIPARAGDRVLVCSDGLTEHVGDRRIGQILRSHKDPEDAANALMRLALAAGGKDNISVIVVDLLDTDQPTALPANGDDQATDSFTV